MAEILGFAASIVAIVQIADRVIDLCKYYIATVEDHPKDLRIILIETSSLRSLLGNLEFLSQSATNSSTILQGLAGENGPIAGCRTAVSELEKLFPMKQSLNKRQRKTAKMVLASLAWPFQAEKARKLLSQLVQHKTSISLALSAESLQGVKDIKRDVSMLCKSVADSKLREICKWLQLTDPCTIHNNAVKNYEAGTGEWVFKTPQWDGWIKSANRCLWIHGIPGAGKTVLAGRLIEEVFRMCKAETDQNWVCVYYYCYHGHNQDETLPFLRWLTSSLCRKAGKIPRQLEELYGDGLSPSQDQLLLCLESIFSCFDKLFVFIDALDESHQREGFLQVVDRLVESPQLTKMQLLATSREYAEIERTMGRIAIPLSMSNRFVAEDIRLYISARLKSVTEFQRWPADLYADVEDALSTKAHGMFRWAVCQLDILRRLKHKTRVREALADLPETLDDTYERIFSCIPPVDRELVRHYLKMTMLHNMVWGSDGLGLSAQILASSCHLFVYGLSREEIFKEFLIHDLEMLKESCGCLLSYNDVAHVPTVTLAHYTVREFLESDRAMHGQSEFFAMAGSNSYTDLATAIFKTGMEVRGLAISEQDPGAQYYRLSIDSDIGFYCIATGLAILCYAQDIQVEGDLVFDFIDPFRPHLSPSIRDQLISLSHWDDLEGLIHFRWDPGYYTTPLSKPGILCQLLWINRIDLATQFVQSTALQEIWAERLEARLLSPFGYLWNIVGNPLEVFATAIAAENSRIPTAPDHPAALHFLLRHFKSLIDPTKELHKIVAAHAKLPRGDCGLIREPTDSTAKYGRDENCPLRMLLEMKADPNAGGYPCTPLQMAVYNHDINAVTTLLQAGADPNSAGDKSAIPWSEDHILTKFSPPSELPPLSLVKPTNWVNGNGSLFFDQSEDCRTTIRDLLIEYGAHS